VAAGRVPHDSVDAAKGWSGCADTGFGGGESLQNSYSKETSVMVKRLIGVVTLAAGTLVLVAGPALATVRW